MSGIRSPKWMGYAVALCLLVLPVLYVLAQDTPESHARALYENYVTMSQANDPARLDLYAEDAKITVFRAYKNGDRLRQKITLAEYKTLLEQTEEPGELTEPVYVPFENTYRIKCKQQRKKVGKKEVPFYPHQLVVGQDPTGNWRILEETVTIDANE